MAAGVLIGILVLSLAVYLFITFGQDARAVNRRIEDGQLAKFNSQFNVYFGRNDIKIHDIISLANLVQENNKYYKNYADYSDSYEIIIYVLGLKSSYPPNTKNWDEAKKTDLINYYSQVDTNTGDMIYTFSCVEANTIYHSNGRIGKIYFNKN